MRLCHRLLALSLLLLLAVVGCARETSAEHAANAYAQQEIAAAPAHSNLADYSLPPVALLKAQHLGLLRERLHFSAEAWGLAQLLLLLAFGGVAWMRDRAVAFNSAPWVQAYSFLLLFLVARVLLMLPLNLYGHAASLHYGLSVQRWSSWFVDLGKGIAIEWLIGGALLMLLVWTLRRFPRRWWLVFWVALLPIVVAGVALAPVVVDPLYNHFAPLARSQPELSAQLEKMGVPRSHQFLMFASAKVTVPNAYVTGLGPTKRIVVWDTSITPNKPPSAEVLWMIGHESGHYALHHVPIGTLLTLAGLLPLFYLLHLVTEWLLARFGTAWRIPTQADWAAAVVLLLAFSVLSTITEPIANGVSRWMEHNADIYGQEAIHSIAPDPKAAVVKACNQDGLRALEDPNPTAFEEFWTYNHPAIGRRAAFGKVYDPWAPGMEPKYFKK